MGGLPQDAESLGQDPKLRTENLISMIELQQRTISQLLSMVGTPSPGSRSLNSALPHGSPDGLMNTIGSRASNPLHHPSTETNFAITPSPTFQDPYPTSHPLRNMESMPATSGLGAPPGFSSETSSAGPALMLPVQYATSTGMPNAATKPFPMKLSAHSLIHPYTSSSSCSAGNPLETVRPIPPYSNSGFPLCAAQPSAHRQAPATVSPPPGFTQPKTQYQQSKTFSTIPPGFEQNSTRSNREPKPTSQIQKNNASIPSPTSQPEAT